MAELTPVDRRFEILRERAQRESRGQTEQEKKGLRRRFAALGGLGSGSAIKQESLAEERGAKRLRGAQRDIEFAELGEQARKAEIKQAQQFQAGEALKGREFAGAQATEQRQFVSGERQAGQQFAGAEALKGREFAGAQAEAQRKFVSGERLSSQDFASLQADIQREFATNERIGQQDFSKFMQDKQNRYATSERLGGEANQRALQSKAQENQWRLQNAALVHASEQGQLTRDLQSTMFNTEMGFKNQMFNASTDQFWASFGQDQRVTDANLILQEMEMLRKYGTTDPSVLRAQVAGDREQLAPQVSPAIRSVGQRAGTGSGVQRGLNRIFNFG